MTTHLTHWGAFEAVSDGERLTEVRPWRGDPEPMPLIDNVALGPASSGAHRPCRMCAAAGSSTARARRDAATSRSCRCRGTWRWTCWRASCAGSTASTGRRRSTAAPTAGPAPGRFHHAQSQVHRFLNCLGGYVRHVNSYSLGTARCCCRTSSATWTRLMSMATLEVSAGRALQAVRRLRRRAAEERRRVTRAAPPRHHARGGLEAGAGAGLRFVYVSPLRDDTPGEAQARVDRAPAQHRRRADAGARPRARAEDLHDRDFLDRYTVGFDEFARYLLRRARRQPKDAAWAEKITGIPAGAHHGAGARDGGDAAPWSASAGRCSAPTRRAAVLGAGHAGRACWARSACPAAASASATARQH